MLNKFNLNNLFFIAITLSIFTLEAQESSDKSADSMEEVITTARRTEESVSDVPIAINAFSGSDLDEKGITNIFTFARRGFLKQIWLTQFFPFFGRGPIA